MPCETAQTVSEANYCPMRHVGFCEKCHERIEETTDVTLALISFPASKIPESKELASEKPESLNQRPSPAEVPQTKQGGQQNQQFLKRKQWTREQKLEFVDLYKKFKNKAKAVREFKARYKVELKSSTYNPWIAQEIKLRSDPKKYRKPVAGRQASYPEMEKQLYKEFKELRSKGIKVKEW